VFLGTWSGYFLSNIQDIPIFGGPWGCRPLTAANLRIRTLYSDGTEIVGQHLMNKESNFPRSYNHHLSPRRIFQTDLVESFNSEVRQESQKCHIEKMSFELVGFADQIVFPMGSIFARILVNSHPKGVGSAIVKRKCPEVYMVPNTGYDPEMNGYTLVECVQVIIDMIREDQLVILHPKWRA
jgi:hypothetical protein